MKKFVKILCVFLLAMSLIGCGNTENESNDKPSNDEETSENNNQTNQNNNIDNEDLPIDELFGLRYYCINLPYWNIYENVDLKICNARDMDIALVYPEIEVSTNEKAHEKAIECYMENMDTEVDLVDVVVEDSKTVNINGIEMYRFEGYGVNQFDKESVDCYVVGYSFILEGKAAAVIGIVSDVNQPKDTISELEEIVDASIQTLRPSEY